MKMSKYFENVLIYEFSNPANLKGHNEHILFFCGHILSLSHFSKSINLIVF